MIDLTKDIEEHPDRQGFEKIWTIVIHPEMQKYIRTYDGIVKENPNAKETIWHNYVMLNAKCKNTYMKSPDKKLDRHKVATCYLFAICLTEPILYDENILSDDPDYYFTFNERIALTTALSILTAYIKETIQLNDNLSDSEKDKLKEKFKNGIKFPDYLLVNHGEYLNNFLSEIHYTMKEENINILATAHELYLLEVLTRLT